MLLTNFPKKQKITKHVLSNLSKKFKNGKKYDKISKNLKILENKHLNFPKKEFFFENDV